MATKKKKPKNRDATRKRALPITREQFMRILKKAIEAPISKPSQKSA